MPFPKLNWRAILWGFMADVVAMETVRYGTWYAVNLWAVSHGDTTANTATMLFHGMLVVLNIAGAVFLVLAGLLTGYLARDTRYANAAVVGAAKVAYNCLGFAGTSAHAPAWQWIIALGAPVPLALLGAFLASFLPAQEQPLPPPGPGGEPRVKVQ